jgi:hypothetical protein
MKPSISIIPLVVYPFDVLLSIDQEDKQLINYCVKGGVSKEELEEAEMLNLPETTKAKAVMFQNNLTLIRLKTIEVEKCELQGYIAHEAFHITTFIMQTIGMKFSLKYSDEAYAYLLGYLVQEINKRIKL